jgi:hypothetical protein
MVDDLARGVAITTRLLNLLDHRAHLTHNHPDSTTTARRARPHGTFLPPTAIAFLANHVAGEGEFCRLALVQFLECDLYAVNEIFALLWTLLP